MREITIYSTTLGKPVVVQSDAKVFEDLIQVFDTNDVGFNISSMRAVIGATKLTLEAKDAVLPTEDFKVFLLPRQTKAGVLTRNECFEKITELKNEFGDKAKIYFGNHTRIGTETLNILIKNNPFENVVEEKVVSEKVIEEKIVEEVIEENERCTKEEALAELVRKAVTTMKNWEDSVYDEDFTEEIENIEQELNNILENEDNIYYKTKKEIDDISKSFENM